VHPATTAVSLPDVLWRLRDCRLCDAAGEPVFSRPVTAVKAGQTALIIGQAPGVHEPVMQRPFAADAGRRMRAWFSAYGLDDEDRFRDVFAMTAVMKCFPGRDPGGRGDRAPRPGQIERCMPWTHTLIRLLDPRLLVPVGGIAIRRILGPGRLVDVVGQRFTDHGRVVIALPHPSGASAWLNEPAHRDLVDRAVALIASELGLSASTRPAPPT
jgi:uracil-DNA glycosylase